MGLSRVNQSQPGQRERTGHLEMTNQSLGKEKRDLCAVGTTGAGGRRWETGSIPGTDYINKYIEDMKVKLLAARRTDKEINLE